MVPKCARLLIGARPSGGRRNQPFQREGRMRAVARVGGKRDPRWFISVSSTRTSPDTASGSARRLTCGRSSSSCRARS